MKKRIILFFSVYIVVAVYYVVKMLSFPSKFTALDDSKTEGILCRYPEIKEANERTFDELQALLNTSFFQAFKINFDTECPFWEKNSRCANKKCLLTELPQSEIPNSWKNNANDRILANESLKTRPELNRLAKQEVWSVEGFENANGTFLSLITNPESFTGYSGTNIWPIIYKENTFKGNLSLLPLEKRLFNRVISGLHASTSTHIAELYADSKDPSKNSPNFQFYFERVANFADRVENIYFSYTFVLKALNIVSGFLENYNLTSNPSEDLKLRKSIKNILSTTQKSCVNALDENKYFSNKTSRGQLVEEIQNYFVNISKIIDCVECEKCRVHAKLQIYGLGTAFKIIFAENPERELTNLRRNELISLINTLGKFSESLHVVDLMHERRIGYYKDGLIKVTLGFLCIWASTYLVSALIGLRKKARKKSEETNKSESDKKNKKTKRE